MLTVILTESRVTWKTGLSGHTCVDYFEMEERLIQYGQAAFITLCLLIVDPMRLAASSSCLLDFLFMLECSLELCAEVSSFSLELLLFRVFVCF